MKDRLFIALIFIVALAGLVLGVFSFTRSVEQTGVEEALLNLNDRLAEEESFSQDVMDILRELAQGNEVFEAALVRSEQERLLVFERGEQTRQALEGKINELETTLESQVDPQTIAKVIAEWSPRIAQIKCDAPEAVYNGSGTLTYIQGSPILITNSHILDGAGKELAEHCDVTFDVGGVTYEVDDSRFALSQAKDLAHLDLESAAGLPVFTSARQCNSEPAVGDEVVILGYPRVGSKESVTATEGIISGFQDDFYITSAKIEKGNSGGAAVHVANNCLLGIPTLTVAGRLESLARILKL